MSQADSDKSLPYPRGFWPLNSFYQLRDITGRNVDFTSYPNDSPVFDGTGPYGYINGKHPFLSHDEQDLSAIK